MRGKPRRVLIVDDEEGARESLEIILEEFYEVEAVGDGMSALTRIREKHFDVVLLDVNMPEVGGLEVLKQIKEYREAIEVIMVSAADHAREAAISIKTGAFDYITKPYEPQDILEVVDKVIRRHARPKTPAQCNGGVGLELGQVRIISQSEKMEQVFNVIEKVAGTASNVLITGESGTGKELVARALHACSPESAGRLWPSTVPPFLPS